MQNIKQDLYVSYIWNAKKPFSNKIKRSFQILKQYQTNQVLVIGDQFITDICFAKRMKYQSLILSNLNNKNKLNFKDFLFRKINNFIYHKLKQKDQLIHLHNYQNQNLILNNMNNSKNNNNH
ncbi:hypothetical protein IKS57_04025 [bacterium]|nr:hypothetical protein [bacterium]